MASEKVQERLVGLFGMVMIVIMVLITTMLLEWAMDPVLLGPTRVAAWWCLLWIGSTSATKQWMIMRRNDKDREAYILRLIRELGRG